MAERKSGSGKPKAPKPASSSIRGGLKRKGRSGRAPARSSQKVRGRKAARRSEGSGDHSRTGATRFSLFGRSRAAPQFLVEIVSVGLIALTVGIVYHRAINYFFFQDDFTSLWIALHGPETLWRILSSYAYFGAVSWLFGLNATAFHVLSLLLHVACAVIVFFLARALSLGRGPSLLASILFALHPSLYVPLYAISSAGEILSALFVLMAALFLLRATRPEAPVAILIVSVLFVASLLSKETTLLFPVLVLPVYLARNMRLRRALPVFVTLVVIAAAYGAFLYTANVFGIREASPDGGAYQLATGSKLVTSLQTYLKWTFNLGESWKSEPFNVLDERALPWLLVGLAAFAVLLAGSGAARVKTAFCVSWFFVMLLPVLPLTGHPYHYYLYIPLAGLAPAFAILLAQLVKSARCQAFVSAVLLAAMLVHSGMLISKIENSTVGNSDTRQEPTFDRAIVSGNLISGLNRLELPEGTKLLLISPLNDIRQGKLKEHPHIARGGPYWDRNVRSAIAEGVGVKLFFPQVDTVAFADGLAPGFEDFRPLWYTWNGHLRTLEPARAWTEAGMRSIREAPDFAFACFKNALREDSLYADAHYYLAGLSMSTARFPEAARALRAFLATAESDPRMEDARRFLKVLESRGY